VTRASVSFTRTRTERTCQMYYFLKNEYDVLRISYKEKGGNPVWYFFKLFLGCVG
jgi:hypothetical protein